MIENSKITPEVFDNLLDLSRLALEEHDRQSIAVQVEQIVSYFDILKQFDIEDNALQRNETQEVTLRSDAVSVGIEQAALKKMSNEYMDGYFRVPKVLESGA
ncbi:MAG: Asp-tRNA(Asn)/Glu-tRNA(Gln) amidotransferase subunit GatC [Treponema sp.]